MPYPYGSVVTRLALWRVPFVTRVKRQAIDVTARARRALAMRVILAPLRSRVARIAQRLPVVLIEEENAVAVVGCLVVNDLGRSMCAELEAVRAPGMRA